MKKYINMFLTNMVLMFTGATTSSLWITNSNSWETYLPISLICISLKFLINEQQHEQR